MSKSWPELAEILRQRWNADPAIKFVLELLAEGKITVESKVHVKEFVTDVFNARFAASMLIHHTINEHRLDKKPFEYAFRDALRADGRKAELDPSYTAPGADIAVDDVPISLKTEGSRGIKTDRIVISKLMESAWMKGYKTLGEFHKSISSHILPHLQKYDRMFMLRAFQLKEGQHYILIEIPMKVLLAVGKVKPGTLTPLTRAKGTSAVVHWEGKPAWTLRFDGSDDKITLTDLPLALCVVHAEWTVKWNISSGK